MPRRKTHESTLKTVAHKVYEKAKAAYDWAKEHKPATKILTYAPAAAKIPYAGKALQVLASAGFGKKKKKKMKK